MPYTFAGRYYNKYKPFFSYNHKDYSFKVDMEFGELLLTRNLIAFSGRHLPLVLSLKYIQRHIYDNSYTGISFPLGFKTNYHVFLEYDSNITGYKYEDMDGFEHDFKLAINSSTLYYDTLGSGLMLTIENNGYKVFDDDGNYQLFDSYGRLVKIHKKITSSHDAEQTITYSNNLTISSITDNYGRTINFAYSGVGIQISYGNNVVITLHTNNNRLTKISKNIDGHLIEETIDQYYLINNILFATGENLEFSYLGDGLTFLKSSLGQDAFAFSYYQTSDQSWATVTNARGISTKYDFSKDKSVSQTTDNNYNVELNFVKINSNLNSCLVKSETENNEITQFTFGNNNLISLNTFGNSNGSSNNIINTNLQSKKMYLLVAEISGNLALDTFEIQLFDYDDNLLADLIFKGKTRQLSFPVGIRASTQKQFYLKYFNKCPNSVEIETVRLVPLFGDFEILCTNIDFGGPIFFYGDEPHYLLKESGVTFFNNNQILHLNLGFEYSDYLANERLFYKNYPSHIWCNDKTKLIDGVSSLLNVFNTTQYLRFSLPQGGMIYCIYDGSSLTPQSFVSFYKVKGKDDNSFSVTKFSHCSPSFHTGFTTYYYEEQKTQYVAGNNGHLTYFDYDENHTLIEVNRDDGYKEEYSYDSNGNLLLETITHSNISKRIEYGYGYDSSNDTLLSESKLIGSSLAQVTHSYDSFGNLSLTHYPNGLEVDFAYDGVSGERKTQVSFYDGNNTEFTQLNNYIDEDNNSLNIGNNEYLFSYDDGNLISVSYNSQTILNITHHVDNYNGVLLSSSQDLLYSNASNSSYSLYTEYDPYNRVRIDDILLYSYNPLTTNLTSIHDSYYSSTYPTLLFTYDYFNQMIETSHLYILLSAIFDYDIYHRLVNQTFKHNSSTIYAVNYLYYDLPNLENTIKESSIIYGNTTVNVSNDVDGFNRLVNYSLSFENKSINKTFDYCVGGPNNSLTNHLISSVTWNYTINNNQITGSGLDSFTYDDMGNMTSFIKSSNNNVLFKKQYYYDRYSRLIRENDTIFGRTYGYAYDNNGNIIAKHEYVYTENPVLYSPPISSTFYSYDNLTYPNRLISFGNQAITYDSVGNPITYRGKTFSWDKGTLLTQISDNNSFVTLAYDGFKQRVQKDKDGCVTKYYYINNLLIFEERNVFSNEIHKIKYLYSHEGIIGFVLSGYNASLNLNGVYLYEKSIQQDVMTIVNSNNQVVAMYAYDAWGNHKVLNPNGTENTSLTFVGNINPIRYRSYYYDTDLKMYWLTTRYYDPEVGRFISPDHYSYLDYQKLHGLNLYAYSKNNPVMYYDPSGHIPFLLFFANAVAFAVTAATVAFNIKIGVDSTYGMANDVIQLASGNINPDENVQGQINNSSSMQTIIGKLGYLVWYKYIYSPTDEKTKCPIKGSIIGATFEWECHNTAYSILNPLNTFLGLFGNSSLSKLTESAKHVNLSSTIFTDSGHPVVGGLMKIAYAETLILTANIPLLIFEIISSLF